MFRKLDAILCSQFSDMKFLTITQVRRVFITNFENFHFFPKNNLVFKRLVKVFMN
jgi:hypothetical protein